VVSELAANAVRANLERHDIELVGGVARLRDGGVEVRLAAGGARLLSGRVVLIATGSRPFRPPEIPFEDPDVHDSDTILGIDRIPGSLIVIGGGPVGCEYASIFTALGVRVTLVDRAERLMPFLDVEASEQLRDCFADMGMRLLLGAPRASVERVEAGLRVALADGRTLAADKVLFAAGRRGNTEES
jgi:NAD(P) transhydrogenase